MIDTHLVSILLVVGVLLFFVMSIFNFVRMEKRRRKIQSMLKDTETTIKNMEKDLEVRQRQLEKYINDQMKKAGS